ncbi:MAG: DUF192 domain-containing protein [Candidatus Nealsonbacteria bacterium]|nr:DUF192 domain-containing protein [Candidatus Nealsonbacteria bacterium]
MKGFTLSALQKKVGLVILILGLCLAGFLVIRPGRGRVCFRGTCFSIELARTAAEQAKGLMFRKELGQDQGLLFVFDQEKILPFWMKNTLIPLDIIWINREQKVVFIEEMARPCVQDPCPLIDPKTEARYVWEIPGGRARAVGLKVGDQLELKY